MIRFPATHLSVLERVRSGEADVRRAAFGDLAEAYWRPSYHYLRLHWHLQPEVAEDIVQGFFATAFEKHYVERYDPARARFRTFLRTCLDRFVQNHQKAERADKRGGRVCTLSLDFPGAEGELAANPSLQVNDADRFFHDETIRTLFSRTVNDLRRTLTSEGRAIAFEVFDRHDLAPTAETTYAGVATSLGLTPSQVTNHLHMVRRRFREAALASLRAMSATEAEYRAEARELFGVEVDE